MTTLEPFPPPPGAPHRRGPKRARKTKRKSSLFSRAEPMLWLTGGTLIGLVAMIAGLLALVVYQGVGTFWPEPLVLVETNDGRALLGEIAAEEVYEPGEHVFEALELEARAAAVAQLAPSSGVSTRRQLRTGNFDLTNTHYAWVSDFEIASESRPQWAVAVERLTWGRFHGMPVAFLLDGERVAQEPAEAWALYEEHHDDVRDRWAVAREIESDEIGAVSRRTENARLALRGAELEHGEGSPEWKAARAEYERIAEQSDAEFTRLRAEIEALDAQNARYQLVLATADGTEHPLGLAAIVRAYPANELDFFGRLGVFFSRWAEFLTDEPREANSEGGVWPAIFGTVLMTMIMSVLVVPFGVLAALYLREYAKQGFVVSTVRIAVNNLAGVPSIVYGVFGLGFFCYIVGGGIDDLLFEARLPNPTYGTGGIMWASLTLALLTLPVVIVATEEALAAVPGSMREGSYACGATRWQTIRRIVLPRAMPGIMTGMILAIARGAGEVAPLMLVGAVKLAPELPVDWDGLLPSLHPERSFMHLGFHIFDLGFQSQNSEAAKPMVYTTTLLLIGIIVALNLTAVWVRGRLRRRFQGGAL